MPETAKRPLKEALAELLALPGNENLSKKQATAALGGAYHENSVGNALKELKLRRAAASGPPAAPVQMVDLASLVVDRGTQMRPMLDEPSVKRYQAAYEMGEPVPPIRVVKQGAEFILWDGFQRREAALLNNLAQLPAEVTEGTLRDAILLAVGANASHGLPRDGRTIENSVWTLLRDPEWRQMSINAIANAVKIHDSSAKKHIENYYQAHPEDRPKVEEGQEGVVKFVQDGKTRTMRTGNIGRGRKPAAEANGHPESSAPPPATSRAGKTREREPGEDDESKAERELNDYLRKIPFYTKGLETDFVKDVFARDVQAHRKAEDALEEAFALALSGSGKAGKVDGPFVRALASLREQIRGFPASAEKCRNCKNGFKGERPCNDCGGAGYYLGQAHRERRKARRTRG